MTILTNNINFLDGLIEHLIKFILIIDSPNKKLFNSVLFGLENTLNPINNPKCPFANFVLSNKEFFKLTILTK